uniref:hypothetical protein n=1 Tax=Escherichia coli TaxID=562 RepID=UPI001BDC6F80
LTFNAHNEHHHHQQNYFPAFHPAPHFSPFTAVLLVSGFFIPRLAAGKRDIDPGFVNRYNYGWFLRKWIDCGYSVGGYCEEKAWVRLLTAWAFVYPVAGI